MKELLWKPSQEKIQKTQMYSFLKHVQKKYSLSNDSYQTLHTWSVKNPALFWEEVWKFCGVIASKDYTQVMGKPLMPGTKWFQGAKLNFAENLLRFKDERPALIYHREDGEMITWSYAKLYKQVMQLAFILKNDFGVQKNDRVASLLPNCIDTVVAMLATTALGAIWSSCSPDFGFKGILDRFGQIEPKVLFAPSFYHYNGKTFPVLDKVKMIQKALPSLKHTVISTFDSPVIPLEKGIQDYERIGVCFFSHVLEKKKSSNSEQFFEQLPFDHPVYIMYSSGTTGIPKCIVHGAGGTLLQHLKELKLHTDLKREDIITYYTTCGWMMWNWLVSSLACGSTLVLYDGATVYPTTDQLWKLAEQHKITVLGSSPKYFSACEKAHVEPSKNIDLSSLRTILSTGSPLSEENFKWIYKHVKKDVELASICGGTDIISCFMLGNSMLPVYSGEIQSLGLGMDVKVYDENAKPVVGKKGELVCETPFPSMPVSFWNDPDGKKYKKAYFENYPGVWRHGDFVELTKHGGVIVYGRSDATLNPGGVRIGTAEIDRIVETHPDILDSIVVGHNADNDIEIVLFVVLKKNKKLDDKIKNELIENIKKEASPRHKPKYIFQVNEIPRTLSGKKVEMAVTQIIHGEEVKNKDALANPQSLEQFKNFFK
ncbi:MAG: acetoacetate--CoA ligase [Deltaproteobacteria bacterium]|nr:acetoacetate--CoA ligase [Deltaproteobacteria bacterium]